MAMEWRLIGDDEGSMCSWTSRRAQQQKQEEEKQENMKIKTENREENGEKLHISSPKKPH